MKPEATSRRSVFRAVGLASVAASQAGAAAAETQFAPLPSFKFDIENQTGWQGPAGSAKEATVAEFPISQSIAGVSMRLKPGAMRELHWHSLAAEWAYMLHGPSRATVVIPNAHPDTPD